MRLSARSKVSKSLQDMLVEGLSTVLNSDARQGSRPPTVKTIRELSKELANRLMANPRFLETLGSIAIKQEKEWLTTQEAAKLSGFSRPFIAALLDSATYTGTVNRTEKGHRRILASDFHQWLSKLRTNDLPSTVADLRTGVLLEPETREETAAEKKVRLKLRKQALETARDLGLT
jgi:hypothetical protein